MGKKETSEKTKPDLLRLKKMVKVTVELPESFIRLLNAKAELSNWHHWSPNVIPLQRPAPDMDAGSIIAWLILLEARGAPAEEIEKSTPKMWRGTDGPKLDHSERKVYEIQQDGTPRYIGGGS